MEDQLSNDSITSLRRTIESEIERINHKIDYITKLKDEAEENLLQQKTKCQEKEALGEIDEELEAIEERHYLIIERQSRIRKATKEYYDLEEALTEINKELTAIQVRHENAMQQLSEKRMFLQERLGSIEKLDQMKVQIAENWAEENRMYENEMSRLKNEREELLKRTDLSPSEMELRLREIDEQIEKLEGAHLRKLSLFNQASSELQAEFTKSFSPGRREEILQELEKLKQQAINATPSELLIIEARMEELNKELEQLQTLMDIQEKSDHDRLIDALEQRGLKLTESGRVITASGRIMTIQEAQELGLLDGLESELEGMNEREKLIELLERRGLTLTMSGRIQLENGEVYTMEEARKMGLLHGLEDELMKLRGITLTASGRILTKDGRILSRSEAEKLGLLDGINLDDLYAMESESEEITESTATTMSGLSSSDVHYLKNVLGKPLALALAEITAKEPRDPIHYLGHWLYKYRYNQEISEIQKRDLADLLEERDRIAKQALRAQAEAEAKTIMLELLGRIERDQQNTADNGLEHMQDTTQLLDAEEDLESEARDTLGVYNGPTRGQQLI